MLVTRSLTEAKRREGKLEDQELNRDDRQDARPVSRAREKVAAWRRRSCFIINTVAFAVFRRQSSSQAGRWQGERGRVPLACVLALPADSARDCLHQVPFGQARQNGKFWVGLSLCSAGRSRRRWFHVPGTIRHAGGRGMR